MESKQPDSLNPVRVYSDATSEEGLASLTLLSMLEHPAPVLLIGQPEEELHKLASTTNAIYLFLLYAGLASVFQLRDELRGRKGNVLVDNETACAALTTRAATNKSALMLVYAIWSVNARYDVVCKCDVLMLLC